jgi:hypothetical protein
MTTDPTLESMKEEDLRATILNYLILNSVYHDGTPNYVSLLHRSYAYVVPFEIYTSILQKNPNILINVESREYNFCAIDISLNMLPEEFVLDTSRREKYEQIYNPYFGDNSFIVHSRLF